MTAALLRRPSSSMKASEVVLPVDHDCTGTVKTGALTASAGREAAAGASPAPHWCSTYTLEVRLRVREVRVRVRVMVRVRLRVT